MKKKKIITIAAVIISGLSGMPVGAQTSTEIPDYSALRLRTCLVREGQLLPYYG